MASTIQMFAHLKIPLKEVVKATNNFDAKNIIGKGDFGKVYRGQLLWSEKMENIAARRLDRKHRHGHIEFLTEISVLSSLKHDNLISNIGFCDEDGEKIIINRHEAKGSLFVHLRHPTFTWIQRLNICIGVARALKYIHNDGEGRGYSVIHRNINSSTVLLDDNWEAKLSGFEFSIKQSVNRKDPVVPSEAIGTTGYVDPETEKTGDVTHKSDIYSFGVVLCEILCGRRAFDPNVDDSLLAPLFICHYEKRSLDDIIHPDLRNQVAQQSLISFSKAAYSCLKEERLQRPDMNEIVHKLENALEVQKRLENLRKNLEHLKIPLGDIMLATDNFSMEYHIRNTECYELYIAELEHFDSESLVIKGEKNKGELSRRSSTVVIKRIIPREDDVVEKVFYTEIEVLNTCKHRNIVKLLGFCDEGSEMILVVEHLSKGYLADYWKNLNDRHILTWVKRLKICLDVAHALNYLHTQMEDEMMIIHRDIRSAYIALDENLGAKIVDFGCSVFPPLNQDYHNRHLSSYYRDPVYWKAGKLKRASDVYSFGVVMFEVLCGKLADDPLYRKESDELGLAFVVRRCFKEGTQMELLDPALKEESLEPNKDSLEKFLKIAHVCVAEIQEERPTMKLVIKELKKAMSFQEQIQQADMVQDVHEVENPIHHELTHENDEKPIPFFLEKLMELLTRENYEEQLQQSDMVKTVEEVEKPQENNDEQIQRLDMVQDVDDVKMSIKVFKLKRENSEEHIQILDMGEIEDELAELLEVSRENFGEQFEHSDTVEVVDEVEKPHENYRKKLEHLKIPLSDIKLATDNFSKEYHIRDTGYYNLYRTELEHFDSDNFSIKEEKNASELSRRRSIAVIKRIYTLEKGAERRFDTEIQMLATCKHPNIIKLFGFCDEGSEMIIVIEDISNGYLVDYFINIEMGHTLTWARRLHICLDVANALNYIHSEMEDQKMIIHRDIKSLHIVLDKNWRAKVIDFGMSVFLPPNQDDEALHLNYIGGTPYYIDPEYRRTGKLKRESDVYSFGVVLFDLLSGGLGREYVARGCFQKGTLMEMMDPMLKEERGENNFSLKRGPNKDSLEKFVKVAHNCIAKKQDQRPTMRVVVKELQEALFFQENNKDEPIISLEDIKLATQNFHDKNFIGKGGFGKVYKGILPHGDGVNTIVAKRLNTRHGQVGQQFRNELQILFEYSHENIIRLVGYCDEKDEKIIVYKYAAGGSLDMYLKDARLIWMKRLNICIDVATALAFLHGGAGKQAIVIHRDIKTSNILLDDEWNTKLADFGLSMISPINQVTDYVIDHACGTPGYLDPVYLKSGFLTKESDIYSFGVVLFEIMCGRLLHVSFIKESFQKGKHDDLVLEALKEKIMPKALIAFQTIAYQCLHDAREKRPTAKHVLEQLKEAREFQISGSD